MNKKNNDDLSLLTVPLNITNAALELELHAKRAGWQDWEFLGIASRSLVDSVREELGAWKSRCSVAEDLNKVYVRMYLEMKDKYDKAVQLMSYF